MVTHQLALAAGYRLDHYQIERVLGKGGFGITYLGIDTQLGKRVAIKELLPDSIATRIEGVTVVPQTSSLQESWDWACERFREEARILAGFSHPAIVEVHRLIEANGTVYMVMDFIDGESYEARLRRIGKEPDQASLMTVMGPILDGLQEVHAQSLLHRDIKPDNILIDKRGKPVLIDFGSARTSVGSTMTMTSMVTHGYSPIEQYQTKGKMGPWTDIYAIGAVMCRAITGEKPPVAADRVIEDDFEWVSNRKPLVYDEKFLNAVDWALRVRAEDRPQNISAFAEHICPAPTPSTPPPVPTPSPVETKHLPVISNPIPQKKKNTNLKGLLILAIAVAVAAPVFYFLGAISSDPAKTSSEASKEIEIAKLESQKAESERARPNNTATPTPKELDEETYEEVTKLVAESDRAYHIGKYAVGLEKISEANRMLPNDPGILLRIARLHEKRGEATEAAAIYNKVLAMQDLGEELRSQTNRKLRMLSPENYANAQGEFGASISILSIVETNLSASNDGKKALQISIKSRSGVSIDSAQVRLHIFFYEKDSSGNIKPTESKIITEWISPPVNWRDNKPELLSAIYTPPGGGLEYLGYVVGIYYKGELESTRSNPISLISAHPLPIYINPR
jgi:serine/threonine protein kinase